MTGPGWQNKIDFDRSRRASEQQQCIVLADVSNYLAVYHHAYCGDATWLELGCAEILYSFDSDANLTRSLSCRCSLLLSCLLAQCNSNKGGNAKGFFLFDRSSQKRIVRVGPSPDADALTAHEDPGPCQELMASDIQSSHSSRQWSHSLDCVLGACSGE